MMGTLSAKPPISPEHWAMPRRLSTDAATRSGCPYAYDARRTVDRSRVDAMIVRGELGT
jgi:hypothetical protein